MLSPERWDNPGGKRRVPKAKVAVGSWANYRVQGIRREESQKQGRFGRPFLWEKMKGVDDEENKACGWVQKGFYAKGNGKKGEGRGPLPKQGSHYH